MTLLDSKAIHVTVPTNKICSLTMHVMQVQSEGCYTAGAGLFLGCLTMHPAQQPQCTSCAALRTGQWYMALQMSCTICEASLVCVPAAGGCRGRQPAAGGQAGA